MAIELNKKTGINLKKGSTISLEKDGKRLEHVCVGLNWGVIERTEKHSFLGFIKWEDKQTWSVDLDGSVSTFAADKTYLDTVYYRKLHSDDGAIAHSGDDLTGDRNGDDGRDNEIIEIDLRRVDSRVQTIVLYLNSFKGQDFAAIPYAKIRVFEGSKHRVDDVLATFNLASEAQFRGFVSMVMGKIVRKPNGNWEFVAIGEPAPVSGIEETIRFIGERYL
ncbi:MAG: TerD family protein [Candidatus Kapabacteria bacterium]|jgi:tellurium resistance protein TerZ|nr:TerD family protein [Candidatus Kapabacteria bacterium]